MPFLAPVIAVIASTIASVGAAVGITVSVATATTLATTLVVSGIISAAEFALGKLLQPHPSISTNTATSQVNIRQPITYRRVIYGSMRVGGVITFIAVSGTNNEYLHFVLTLAGHEVDSINEMYFDGVQVPIAINGGGATDGGWHPTSGQFLHHVLVEKHLGDPSDTSQPFPLLAADLPSSWTSSHLQRGCAKVHVRVKWSADVFPNGAPSSIAFKINGKKVFDPRTSTTAFSNNTALCLRDFLVDSNVGMGVDPATIDDASVIAAANVCDEAMVLREGGTQARYTCDGAFDTSIQRGQVIASIVSSMSGVVVPPGDSWQMYPGAYRDPVLEITDDDLRGPIKMDTRPSRRDLANAIKGTYMSPDNNWQMSDFPPYKSADYVTEDGGETIFGDITLDFCTDGVRAQRLAKISLEKTRRLAPLVLACKLKAFKACPGDTISFTHSRFGFSAKTYMVTNSALVVDNVGGGGNNNSVGAALGVDMALVAVDPLVYAWDPDVDEGTVEAVTVPPLPASASVQPVTGLTLLSDITTSIVRLDGIAHSQIKVTWTPPVDQMVLSGGSIEVWIKQTSDPDSAYILDGRAAGDASVYYVADNITDGIDYTVKLVAVNSHGAHSVDVTGTVTCSGAISAIPSGSTDIINYDFEFSTTLPPAGWSVDTGVTATFDTSSQYQGNRSAKIATSTHLTGLASIKKYAVVPGDFFTGERYKISGYILGDGGVGAGQVSFVFYDKTDTAIGSIDAVGGNPTPAVWTRYEATGVVPTGAVYARVQLQNYHTTGTAVNLEFDQLELVRLLSLEDEIHDGPTRGAMTAANTSYRPLTNPLHGHDNGTTAEIDVDSFVMRVAKDTGGTDISLNSGVISGLLYGTTYHVYYDDPSYSGGAVTYFADTNQAIALNSNGRFYVGSIITPVAGGADTIGNNDGGTGAQSGQLYLLSPSLRADDSTDPVSWYPANELDTDGDTSTYLPITSVLTSWLGGFPTIVAKWTSLKLKVHSQVVSIAAGGAAFVDYSLDDGSTWTNIYNVANGTAVEQTATAGANDGGAGTAWTNPSNAAAPDNFATITGAAHGTVSQYLKATAFGFAGLIPSGATILGIIAKFDETVGGSASEVAQFLVRLLKAGTPVGDTKTVNGQSAATLELGDNADLWGTTWADTDITDPNFGAEIAASAPSPASSWVGGRYYSPLGVVIDSNGNLQQVLTPGTAGGSAPTWGTSVGAITTDGGSGLTWKMIQTAASLVWAANTHVDVGTYKLVSVSGVNHLFQLSSASNQMPSLASGTKAYIWSGSGGAGTSSGAFNKSYPVGSSPSTVSPASLHWAGITGANTKVFPISGNGTVGVGVDIGFYENWQAAIVGKLYFPAAGQYTFRIQHDDGCMIGFESGVTKVSGTLTNPRGQTRTAKQGYSIFAGVNGGGSYTTVVTVSVAAAGTYGFEIDYSNWQHAGSMIVNVKDSTGAYREIVPQATATITGAVAPVWPTWSTAFAPSYPSVTESAGNYVWYNRGPATDFVWSASIYFTLAATVIQDSNLKGQTPYRAGVSGVSQPLWSTITDALTADNTSLIWRCTGTISVTTTFDFGTRNVVIQVTYRASGSPSSRALTTDEVTLPLTQNLGLVQVRFGNDLEEGEIHMHEVWIEAQAG
jgi:hypothetical protein